MRIRIASFAVLVALAGCDLDPEYTRKQRTVEEPRDRTPPPAVATLTPDPVPSVLQAQQPGPTIDPVKHLEEGKRLMGDGQISEAISEIEQSIIGDPTGFEAHFLVGVAYRESGDNDKAAGAFQTASTLDLEDETSLVNLARVEIARETLDEALSAAKEAVKRVPKSGEAHNVMGRVHLLKSEWQAAEIAFNKSIELKPSSPFAYNNLGLTYLRSGRYDEAVEVLEIAVMLPPVTAYMHNNLGLAYENSEQPVEAEQAYLTALELRPSYVKAKLNQERVQPIAVSFREELNARRSAMVTGEIGEDDEFEDDSDDETEIGSETSPEPGDDVEPPVSE